MVTVDDKLVLKYLDLLGQKFVVEGYVTSQSEAVAPKNAFFEVVYIEDATGGICVFGI